MKKILVTGGSGFIGSALIRYIINKTNYRDYLLEIIKKKCNLLIKFFKKKKISSVFHYIPLLSSPFGKYCSKTKSSMKNTNFIANNLLRLPIHLNLSRKIQVWIVKQVYNFFQKNF